MGVTLCRRLLESKDPDSDGDLKRTSATRMDIVCKETAQQRPKELRRNVCLGNIEARGDIQDVLIINMENIDSAWRIQGSWKSPAALGIIKPLLTAVSLGLCEGHRVQTGDSLTGPGQSFYSQCVIISVFHTVKSVRVS